MLVGDNLNVHRDVRLRALIDARDRLTVYCLPPYAPDLNPVESVWSMLRRSSQTILAFTEPGQLLRSLRRGLREIQYRSDLITGCLAAWLPSPHHPL
ncbi:MULTISPECIES: transposase [Streptosporangium]|uniref:Transposase n=1 Tax=Streptosporangium brasiliense TaxID=47480 RepID=A0ABT9RMY4_9ACTN|nr:transposase [Streptosporangium brasiliense]MDP9869675.1 transposase [Streptosporangium brasiliense]